MPHEFEVVIVGAGHAGTHLATSLAASTPNCRVALISDEAHAPYDRPTLSKGYLLGKATFSDIELRTAQFWAASGVDLRLGRSVVAVDPVRRTVTCSDESVLHYGSLVWAAGGRARRLPESVATAPYYTVRSLADVHAMQPSMSAATHATIVGGGYIGLEAAAVLRSLGVAVTVIESAPRVLARVAGGEISDLFEREHRRAGVDVRLNASLSTISLEGERPRVRLGDDSEFSTDLVVVGIGMVPNVEVMRAAGAAVDDGLLVDDHCRTSLSDVFAMGDCARHVSRFAGGAVIRLECVQNATDQAKVVHAALCGSPIVNDSVPWFWSNQYDVRFKSAGLATSADSTIVRGDVESSAFSVVHLRHDVIVAADCVNTQKDFMQAKRLIAAEARLNFDSVRDPSVDLRDTVRRAGAALA